MKTYIASGFILALLSSTVVAVPVVAQTRTLEFVGFIPGPAETVYTDRTHAYISDGLTLRIFDINNPAAPTFVGSYDFPQKIYGVTVAASIAYAAVDFLGLGILDVSNPAAPKLLGFFETGGQALGVGISGSTAVIANRLSGLEIIDVADPSTPTSKGAYFTEGYATDVAVEGTTAYVVDRPGGLSIIDLSKPGEPDAESTQITTERAATVAAGRQSEGTTLAAVLGTDSLLEIFDVSDSASPVSVSTYRHPERPATGRTIGWPRARFSGALAFMADAYPPFLLQAIDLSDATDPTLVATYEPPGSPGYISVSGSLVFVTISGDDDRSTEPGVLILRLNS